MKQVLPILAAGFCAASACAGLTGTTFFDSYETWSDPDIISMLIPGSWSNAIRTDDFSSIGAGSYGAVGGGLGWSAWNAYASSGNIDANFAAQGLTVHDDAASMHFDFTGPATPEGGLHGIGGYFGLRDGSGVFIPGTIQVTLSNGVSDVRTCNGAEFVGWWISTPDVTITSLDVRPVSSFVATGHVAVTELSFGYAGNVPAPGSLALLGIARAIVRRPRR